MFSRVKDRLRSPHNDAPATAGPSSASAVFPSLHKLDLTSGALPPGPASTDPLLTLLLSKPSFLDTVVSDGTDTLYFIESRGPRTAIYRTSAAGHGSKICYIRWPSKNPLVFHDVTSGVTVQMGKGRPKSLEEFLKYGSLFTYVSS